MRIFTKIIYGLFILGLLGVTGLFLASLLPIPGNIEVKIVKSGSMAPAIPTGSLVVVKPATAYGVGDVITFGEDNAQQIPTTHRIVSVDPGASSGQEARYHTKGDANEEADPETVLHSEVIGKVFVAAPYAGFVLDFAKQPLGFALLIGVPAGLIILEELLAIARETRILLRKRRQRSSHVNDEDLPPTETSGRDRRMVVSIMLVFMVGTYTVSNAAGATLSYFSDLETSIGNIFQAGEWIDPQSPFNIVLNEFLPNPDNAANGLDFGDDASNMPDGEWIEIYNKGNAPIDVEGWYMTDASGGVGNTHAFINDSNTNTGDTILAAHGWLVVYLNKPSLNNTGDEIYLYTSTSTGNQLIDSYSYDDPSDFCELELTPGSTNDGSVGSGTPGNGNSGDCIANQVAPNKSYARIPDGVGAFVDPIPTPGTYNIAEEPAPEQESSQGSTLAKQGGGGGSGGGGAATAPELEQVVEVSEPVVEITEPAEEPVVEVSDPIVEITPGPAEETPLGAEKPAVEVSEPVVGIIESESASEVVEPASVVEPESATVPTLKPIPETTPIPEPTPAE